MFDLLLQHNLSKFANTADKLIEAEESGEMPVDVTALKVSAKRWASLWAAASLNYKNARVSASAHTLGEIGCRVMLNFHRKDGKTIRINSVIEPELGFDTVECEISIQSQRPQAKEGRDG